MGCIRVLPSFKASCEASSFFCCFFIFLPNLSDAVDIAHLQLVLDFGGDLGAAWFCALVQAIVDMAVMSDE